MSIIVKTLHIKIKSYNYKLHIICQENCTPMRRTVFLFGNNSDKTGYCMHKFDKNWAKCYNIKMII